MAAGIKYPGEDFKCDCGGSTRKIAENLLLHSCRSLFAQHQGMDDRAIRWKRVQINPSLTGGLIKYRWFVDWN